MDLFATDPKRNLLPCDGTVCYHGRIVPAAPADRYLETLLTTIPWQHDEAVIFGRRLVTGRMVAWYGDAGFLYTYSGTTKKALPWTPALLEIKALVERHTEAVFNSCLLNFYHHGEEGMAWHSDDERSLGRNSMIASVSFGAERKFALKHKKLPHKASIFLEHGSLLVMKDTTQTHWLHSLPKTKKVKEPRVNLTFRTMVG